jgi:ankyrin repeat protein
MRAFFSMLVLSCALFGLEGISLHAYYNNNDKEGFRAAVTYGGFDVDQENEFGQTVLHLAAKDGKLDWITMLHSLKASMEKEDSRNNWTPIRWAMSAGHYQAFKLLKENGAKIIRPTIYDF